MMAFWLGLPSWARTALMWTGAIIIAIITGKLIIDRHDDRIRKEDAAKAAIREAKERAILVEAVAQKGRETEDAKDRALEAPRHVDDVTSADDLRERYPDNASVILRPRDASSGKGPR